MLLFTLVVYVTPWWVWPPLIGLVIAGSLIAIAYPNGR